MSARFGRRLRRGAATTAVAAVAMAALTASQAPDLLDMARDHSSDAATPTDDTPIDGGSPYYTELPPLTTSGKPGSSKNLPNANSRAQAGIPATVLAAYKRAEAALAESKPGCHLPWELLAAIGKVESGQARGGAVDAEGTTVTPILGPSLDGNGFARITDTDGGVYDGDPVHDRAVGPMQFIPSTWATWGADGNGDGEKNPNNIYDAALAAGRYLCAGDRDLAVEADLHRAILGYNHSRAYLRTVLSWFEFYKKGTHEVPDGTGVLPAGAGPYGDDPKNSKDGSGRDSAGSGSGSDQYSDGSGSGSGTGGTGDAWTLRPTTSASGTISPAPSASGSDGSSSSPSPSPTECPSDSASPSPSESPSGSTSPSGSPSPTPTTSDGSSSSPSPTSSDSAWPSPSPSPSDDPCGDGSDAEACAEPSPTS